VSLKLDAKSLRKMKKIVMILY